MTSYDVTGPWPEEETASRIDTGHKNDYSLSLLEPKQGAGGRILDEKTESIERALELHIAPATALTGSQALAAWRASPGVSEK